MAKVIYLQEDDDLTALRDSLRRTQNGRVVFVLPWNTPLLSRLVDVELVRREAERLGLELALVIPDPERRALVRWGGLPVFPSVAAAEAAAVWPRPERPLIQPPRHAWWEEEMPVVPPPAAPLPLRARRVRQGIRALIFVATLLFLLASAYIIVPRATVTLVAAGQTIRVIVPVSVDMEMESVDPVGRVIPARRVGDYFEGFIEVETTGLAAFESGHATGSVLFTNLLGQEVMVPAGTGVRTSAGSFPIRFVTTQDVLVPPFGQALAPIEAVEEGPAGNVGANQINLVEGIAGLAIRVTNPEPTSGGASQEVRAVSQADMDRARALLTAQLLDEAYRGLQGYLESVEFLPRQSLEIQASEIAYDRFLTERADRLGLHMRLLITGLAVDQNDAGAVAYAVLSRRLPASRNLVEADFEIGEVAEEPIGVGNLTFFVTATGYATAKIDLETLRQAVAGQPIHRAVDRLEEMASLAEPPRIQVWPEWLGRMPVLPVRISIQMLSGR